MTLDRSKIATALAKAIAYKQCGKQQEAEQWARELITLLECANILATNTCTGETRNDVSFNNGSSRDAFERAIAQGRLSNNPNTANYAGRYMYMGPATKGGDAFKHIQTREYIK